MEFLSGGLITILAFLFVISVVVVIHELGHYWAGRMCGIHAEVFSIGFGPTLYNWRDKRGTVWRIAGLPLGGYVRFLGDAGAASEPDSEKLAEMRAAMGEDAQYCFHFKPVWQRAWVTFAGPLANFILAFFVFAALATLVPQRYFEPVVGSVMEDSAAEAAGIEPGDRVLAINGRAIEDFSDITAEVAWRPGQTIQMSLERAGETIVLPVTPQRLLRPDAIGGEREIGVVGIGNDPEAVSWRRFGPIEGMGRSIDRIGNTVSLTGRYVGSIVTGQASAEYLSGPIGIASTAGGLARRSVDMGRTPSESAYLVLVNLVNLIGFFSIGLGLVNLLPIPILDGGHLVYYAYEAVARRPLSMKAQAFGFRVGLALVLGMMLLATWNDINYQLGQLL